MNQGAFVFEREGDGRYQVYLRNPRLRLGMVDGRPGYWIAVTPDGGGILARWRTRVDAAAILLELVEPSDRAKAA